MLLARRTVAAIVLLLVAAALAQAQTPGPAARAGTSVLAGLLKTIDGAPQSIKVTDLLGHERRVWSASGTGNDDSKLQVEVMVWWCDQRDMTFIGAYATQGTHNLRDGVDTLLPAVCH